MPPKKGSKKKAGKAPPKEPSPRPSPPPVSEEPTNVIPEQEQQDAVDAQMATPSKPTEPEPTTVMEAAGEIVKNVADAAVESLEGINGEDMEKESKLSIEDRKTKMEQLRAKMVTLCIFVLL